MPRRHLVGLAGPVIACLPLIGCKTEPPPEASPRPNVSTEVKASGIVAVGQAPPASLEKPVSLTVLSPKGDIAITPEAFTITADDPGVQLLVTQRDTDGTTRDLTASVEWGVAPPGIATIEPGGYLRPVGGGKVSVSARLAGAGDARGVAGTIEPRPDRPWDFAEDIVPILTRLGCNTGACHGKADGQNGFHLSLSGYDPEGDYRAMVRDAAQRRVSRVGPERSLVLGKATGRVPHGGGPRLAVGSPEYRTLIDWIGAGAPERRAGSLTGGSSA